MSTPLTPAPMPAPAPAPRNPGVNEIRIISHSSLFYWWPVWFFGFLFSLWTYVDNTRMAIVPHESEIIIGKAADGSEKIYIDVKPAASADRLKKDAVHMNNDANVSHPKARVSARPWMGPIYIMILLMVIIITNVPLRGLWSLVVIISTGLLAMIISLMEWWDTIFASLGDLHVYINMAGYLTISTVLFIAWACAVWIFDRRTYIVFTPGQVKVCEELGGREKVYDTTQMTVEKQRSDWFRHMILGFGTGDLTVKTAGAERHEILMPNVALIGTKIDAIELMLRERNTKGSPA